MSTNCKIGKVRYKTNVVQLVQKPEILHFYTLVEWLRKQIDNDTHAVVVGILDNQREFKTGCSYNEGFTVVDLYGMVERIKQDNFEDIWVFDN